MHLSKIKQSQFLFEMTLAHGGKLSEVEAVPETGGHA